MTVLLGDTGKVAYGSLKTLTITPATPRETLLGTPTALPTTEPGTSQISFTIQSSDLPTISPSPVSTKYIAVLFAAGKNTDAASQSVTWRVLKNGSSVATGTQSAIATNTFWTQSHYQFFDVAVGDVLEVRLWSSSANVNYDYFALCILPTRTIVGKSTTINANVNYTIGNFTLSSGVPVVSTTNGWNIYPASNGNINTVNNLTLNALSFDSSFGIGRTQFGEINILTSTQTHATNRPFYARNAFPTQLSFREVLR